MKHLFAKTINGMKKFYVYTFLILLNTFSTNLLAQQIPTFNNQLYAPVYFNPARLGDGFIGINYRQQWSDLSSDLAPTSFLFISDLSSLTKLNQHRVGLGLSFLSDKAHILHKNLINLNFAYHLIDASDKRLSLGISVGWLSQKLNFGDSRIADPFDLAIFSGEHTKSVFEGGLGLSLQLFPSEKHLFNLDISLPQLYNSELNFDNNSMLELNPHLVSRISYMYNGGTVGFEPILMYREAIGGKKLKAANLEAGLRILFLDKQFWIGTGMRLETETIQLNIGANLEGLQIFGSYEIGAPLGNTIEVGGLYTFGKSPKEKLSGAASIAGSAIDQFAAQFNSTVNKVTDYFNLMQSNLNDWNQGNGTNPVQQNKLSAIKRYNNNASEGINTLTQLRKEISDNLAIIDTEINKNSAQRNSKLAKNARRTNLEIQQKYQELNGKHQQYIRQIAALEKQIGPDVSKIIRRGNLADLKAYYQQQLDALPSKPRNILPVVVNLGNQNLQITYEFPNGKEAYDMKSPPQKDTRNLIHHIVEKIQELAAQNYEIKSIDIFAKMRVSADKLSYGAGKYTGEFGNPISINYKLYDRSQRLIITKVQDVLTGAINLENLAALKLHSFKTNFQEQNPKVITVNLQIIAPADQRFPQMYQIKVNVER